MQNRPNKFFVILCAFFIISSSLSMMMVSFSFRGDETQGYPAETLESSNNVLRETNNEHLFTGYDPVIHQMMNETEESNIYDHIDTLQNFENENGTRTRRDGTQGFERAVNWTFDKLDSFGLDVFKQNFTYSEGESSNVIAELPGSNPELDSQTYIIGAHLDSINSDGENESAPGADDNGSGVALMLEVARILSQYEFDRTIRFAAWGAEELGLHGSSYYASNIDPEEDMRGKFNYDMVGYSEEDEHAITLHANEESRWMLDYQKDVAETYDIGLNFTYEYNSTETRSDHASFWDEGYDASLAIETEFNPYYHSEEDTLDKLTIPQITKLTSHAVGTLAHIAEAEIEPPSVEIETLVGEESWKSNSEEEIRWYTEVGSGDITGVDLEYSLDNGSSWKNIATNMNDTGSYLWTVPEESTNEARIRITVHDEHGMSAQDISSSFTIEKDEGEKEISGFTLPVMILGILIAFLVRREE